MKSSAQIIAPNFKRHREREAEKAVLKSKIGKRFQEQLAAASLWERFKIWIQITREVETELDEKFPPSAMYWIAR
ncbi:MAG: hypothetical protein QM715_12965 [Nibricoccus sp.]